MSVATTSGDITAEFGAEREADTNPKIMIDGYAPLTIGRLPDQSSRAGHFELAVATSAISLAIQRVALADQFSADIGAIREVANPDQSIIGSVAVQGASDCLVADDVTHGNLGCTSSLIIHLRSINAIETDLDPADPDRVPINHLSLALNGAFRRRVSCNQDSGEGGCDG